MSLIFPSSPFQRAVSYSVASSNSLGIIKLLGQEDFSNGEEALGFQDSVLNTPLTLDGDKFITKVTLDPAGETIPTAGGATALGDGLLLSKTDLVNGYSPSIHLRNPSIEINLAITLFEQGFGEALWGVVMERLTRYAFIINSPAPLQALGYPSQLIVALAASKMFKHIDGKYYIICFICPVFTVGITALDNTTIPLNPAIINDPSTTRISSSKYPGNDRRISTGHNDRDRDSGRYLLVMELEELLNGQFNNIPLGTGTVIKGDPYPSISFGNETYTFTGTVPTEAGTVSDKISMTEILSSGDQISMRSEWTFTELDSTRLNYSIKTDWILNYNGNDLLIDKPLGGIFLKSIQGMYRNQYSLFDQQDTTNARLVNRTDLDSSSFYDLYDNLSGLIDPDKFDTTREALVTFGINEAVSDIFPQFPSCTGKTLFSSPQSGSYVSTNNSTTRRLGPGNLINGDVIWHKTWTSYRWFMSKPSNISASYEGQESIIDEYININNDGLDVRAEIVTSQFRSDEITSSYNTSKAPIDPIGGGSTSMSSTGNIGNLLPIRNLMPMVKWSINNVYSNTGVNSNRTKTINIQSPSDVDFLLDEAFGDEAYLAFDPISGFKITNESIYSDDNTLLLNTSEMGVRLNSYSIHFGNGDETSTLTQEPGYILSEPDISTWTPGPFGGSTGVETIGDLTVSGNGTIGFDGILKNPSTGSFLDRKILLNSLAANSIGSTLTATENIGYRYRVFPYPPTTNDITLIFWSRNSEPDGICLVEYTTNHSTLVSAAGPNPTSEQITAIRDELTILYNNFASLELIDGLESGSIYIITNT